ncbi:hypothetical protein ASZ90_016469 [hydrocarbon metagenome]|uniref:Uncharacterized protein n=1 Tax=hydrocarbon metagenome TaxID=938273 RepID=A0A0W8ESW2_9ZZZZ
MICRYSPDKESRKGSSLYEGYVISGSGRAGIPIRGKNGSEKKKRGLLWFADQLCL